MSLLSHHPPFYETQSLTVLKLARRLAGQWTPGKPPALGLQACATMLTCLFVCFCTGSGDQTQVLPLATQFSNEMSGVCVCPLSKLLVGVNFEEKDQKRVEGIWSPACPVTQYPK